ncbi:zinc finger CCCH domain-containing protein 10-like [Liolophura sinensis]|uniref:zinc finger CCCH domain-containing protein 10-like n=1 Tax=Liolophura sinensis TaxID=3198878 RepID=UPI003159040A
MSDNSDCSSEEKYMNGVKGDDICRDYLRNVCKRGKRCKYRHPDSSEAKELGRRQEYTFCHDFQNTGCRRANCKFLHCTREEEDHHKQTGQLPVRLQQAAALGIGVTPKELPLLRGEVPICKDYLNGECKRGAKCKFRHVSGVEYEFEVRKSDHTPLSRTRTQSKLYDPYEDEFERFERFEYEHTPLKRRRSEFEYESRYSRPLSYQLLEDENTMLRRKVDELKKQVADLTATNEVLLEQNARYRVSKSNVLQSVPSASPVSQPISVSQPLTTVVTPAPAVAAPAPAPGPPPCNHLNTSLTQQLALKCDMTNQQIALQQRITASGAGNMATATLTPQAIVPVSLPQSSISVSLSHESLHQSLNTAASLAQSLPQSLSMSGPSTPLVSYPIVSQSMGTVVHSSLAH